MWTQETERPDISHCMYNAQVQGKLPLVPLTSLCEAVEIMRRPYPLNLYAIVQVTRLLRGVYVEIEAVAKLPG